MASAEIGPIWRSVRRRRVFALLVVEVALGFFIIGNLLMSIRWYAAHVLPLAGHRETDLVEVSSRGPATSALVSERGRRDALAALAALPGVRGAVAVSSTALNDRWGEPDVFWADGGALGPSACPNVTRSPDGVVVGWAVGAGPGLVDALDLPVVEGTRPAARAPAPGVLVTRCLRDALFGGAPALGRVLRSNHYPPAPIVGVVEDVRFNDRFLYQTQVTAIYPAVGGDARVFRALVRTEPGRAEAVRAAVALALADASGPDGVLSARVFSEADTRTAGIARGTIVMLVHVGGLLGLLAILGNFAVAAFIVGDRIRIIGVRRALGATRWDVLRYLLIENVLPTQLGNLLGLVVVVASLPAAKLRFAGIQFDIIDAVVAALLLSLGGLLANLVPALRATRIPPSVVTRSL